MVDYKECKDFKHLYTHFQILLTSRVLGVGSSYFAGCRGYPSTWSVLLKIGLTLVYLNNIKSIIAPWVEHKYNHELLILGDISVALLSKDHKNITTRKNTFFPFFCATGLPNRFTELRDILDLVIEQFESAITFAWYPWIVCSQPWETRYAPSDHSYD